MKNLLLIFFLSFKAVSFSQNYISFRNTLNEGNFWFYEQNFDSAYFYYKKAEQYNIQFFPEEIHLYSRTLWELGFNKNSLKILKKGGVKDFFLRDTTYYKGLSNKERYEIASKLKFNEIDLLTERMPFYDSLHVKDQMYRKIVMSYPDNSKQKDSIIKLMNYQDSLNIIELIDEIKKNGYPGGYKMAPVGPGVVLLHTNPLILLNYYSVLINEIEKGRMSFYDFSKAIDRMFALNEKEKPYNSYMPVEESEVGSPILVFVNRCSIGMSPYYDVYIPRLYPRGKTPPKSKLFDFYKKSKQNFNCCRIK
jgi:hypothetical protein